MSVTFTSRIKLPPIRHPLQRIPIRLRVPLVVNETTELLERLEATVATADHGLVIVIVDTCSENV